LADQPIEHPSCPDKQTVPFFDNPKSKNEDVIFQLEKMQQIRPAKYSLNDYNYEIPNMNLGVEEPALIQLPPPVEREIYEYPGYYSKKNTGERLVNIRMQEEEAKRTTITGKSNCPSFVSGYQFELSNYFREDMNNKSYVLTSVKHEACEGNYPWIKNSGSPYKNSFTCIPYEIPFRPSRKTPKPLICGTQTAFVTGPPGNEIYSDSLGRVKVQFHWDRVGKKDESSSCWIRVGHSEAGKNWGSLDIPRIGHEVIVSFEEGDPDRPLITGQVYNGLNLPPYAVKDADAKSTVKVQSIGGNGNNEFRFDATENSEEIYLHGQKDWNIHIENDKNQTIGNDEQLTVKKNRDKIVMKNQSETINQNKNISVGENHKESIYKNMEISVKKKKRVNVGSDYFLNIKKKMDINIGQDKNETVEGSTNEDISKSKNLNIGADYKLCVSEDMFFSVDANKTEEVGKSINFKVSEQFSGKIGKEYQLSAQKVILEAKDEISFKCGSALIALKKNGDIQIKGSGNVIIKGSKITHN